VGKIFVNYRRDDSAPHALSIAQYLERRFGARNVFIDIDRLRAGQNFRHVLEQRLSVCDVMLTIIGPSWREARDETGRHRLDNPEDWVRTEITRALVRGITVIPVLVGGAALPRSSDLPADLGPLSERQAVTVTTNSFRTDMAGLEHDLRAIVRAERRWRLPVLGAMALLLALAAFAYLPIPPKPGPRPDPAGVVRPDFSAAEEAKPPRYLVAAEPYLRNNEISISVSARRPAESIIVFVNNLGLYGGRAVAPTTDSQNFLTQIDTGNVPASFTLKFSKPLSSFKFIVPKVFPATESGITFPGWRAIARSDSGAELSSASEALTRRFADVPSRTYTLTAPGFEGISAVEFQSDPNLSGRPFAAFSTIVIEQIELQPR
jgi:hypothetical protein